MKAYIKLFIIFCFFQINIFGQKNNDSIKENLLNKLNLTIHKALFESLDSAKIQKTAEK